MKPQDVQAFIDSVHLTKQAKDLPPEAAEALLADLKRGARPGPTPTDRKAAEMTAGEQREWLAAHRRRFNDF
ncbi:hypothetical protein CK489_29130 [Bradyrhizobium sp. UFLA03-84]|uniref:hypothetical protein n=1 Tax=Bradyrhizobium sp. UFLA03-84 TaxID=418599 RepID=UPI000BAE5DC9|nr:hypothetical protein [Bradyrhizobium sp. UFLA03-84]PAY05449.1 hypothetical protein CK489_29130 [Bradyrhizobium sp. UFLA03-84]